MPSEQDRLSVLPEAILTIIICLLPLKDAIQTSILAKSWRNLWRTHNDVEINERHFFALKDPNQNENSDDQSLKQFRQRSCIDFGYNWVQSKELSPSISSFTLIFSNPRNYLIYINHFISVALLRRPKSLELDFSCPDWEDKFPTTLLDSYEERCDLPNFVYNYELLESLKLISCRLRYDNLMKLGDALKTVFFGWMKFTNESNLWNFSKNCPLLESFTLFKCFNCETYVIESHSLKTLVVDRCVDLNNLSFITPNLRCYKYNGNFVRFGMIEYPHLEMVELDFRLVGMLDEEHGDEIVSFLSHFHHATSLSVCNYCTQVIPLASHNSGLSGPSFVRDLTIKTAFHESEFDGIHRLIESHPLLQKLQFILVEQTPFEEDLVELGYYMPGAFDWNIVKPSKNGCLLNKALKVVEIQGFQGTLHVIGMLNILVNYGKGLRKLILKVAENDQNARDMAGYVSRTIQQLYHDRVDVVLMS